MVSPRTATFINQAVPMGGCRSNKPGNEGLTQAIKDDEARTFFNLVVKMVEWEERSPKVRSVETTVRASGQ